MIALLLACHQPVDATPDTEAPPAADTDAADTAHAADTAAPECVDEAWSYIWYVTGDCTGQGYVDYPGTPWSIEPRSFYSIPGGFCAAMTEQTTANHVVPVCVDRGPY